MIRKYIWLFVLVIITGCVKETDWVISDGQPRKVVVDAVLSDEPGSHSVRIYYNVSSLNETPEPVTGALVYVTNIDSTILLKEDSLHPGNYMTHPDYSVASGKNYTLQIYYQGTVYSAKTTMEPGITFDPLRYRKNDGDDLYHIDFVASAFGPEDPAMWEVLLDWSMVPGYNPADSLNNRARLLFYTLPSIDVAEIFAPDVEKISFPAGTVVTQKRYSLTANHAAFVRELLSETSWQGGIFSTFPSNVSTNLSNGATGYFAVCGVKVVSFTVGN